MSVGSASERIRGARIDGFELQCVTVLLCAKSGLSVTAVTLNPDFAHWKHGSEVAERPSQTPWQVVSPTQRAAAAALALHAMCASSCVSIQLSVKIRRLVESWLSVVVLAS